MSKNHGIPTGRDHIQLIGQSASAVGTRTADAAKLNSDIGAIGTALCALYQAATCHRKCLGGAHLAESLCGRAYNLACSAILLVNAGYYDEGIAMVRGVSEIYNIAALATSDKKFAPEWLVSDKATRIREFGPAKIRRRLKLTAPQFLVADPDWYGTVSEDFVHPSPNVKPNRHDVRQGHAGGSFQQSGLDRALEDLANVVVPLGLLACKNFGFDDLFDDLTALVQAEGIQQQ